MTLGTDAYALWALVPLSLKEGRGHREFDIPKAPLVGIFLMVLSVLSFQALSLFLLMSATT